jgi:hypothetical protein
MAGSLIPMPVNGAADWSSFVTMCVNSMKGQLFVSLSNFTGTTAPEVEDGSYCDINGVQYRLTAAGATEAITGLAAIANSSTIYFYAVPSGTSVTIVGSTTAPTWSETKGGYYNGNNRCIGGCYKNAAGNYVGKWIINEKIFEGGRTLKLTGDGGLENYFINETGVLLTSKSTTQVGVGNTSTYQEFYLKKAITAYIKMVSLTSAGVGTGYAFLDIKQNGNFVKMFGNFAGAWANQTTAAQNSTVYFYSFVLNPGHYRLGANALVSNTGPETTDAYLYCTGVYCAASIQVDEVITLV